MEIHKRIKKEVKDENSKGRKRYREKNKGKKKVRAKEESGEKWRLSKVGSVKEKGEI